jgi:hypothetical protein
MRRLRCFGVLCALASACDGGSNNDESTGSDPTGTTASDPTGGERVALVTPMAWTQVAAADDPLADHRPAAVMCPLGAWVFEEQGLEVSTATCNYGMFTQPSLVDVAAGARLTASVYHFDLVAEEPATAHVALLIGEAVIWEEDIAIPGPANAFTIDLPAASAWPKGTPVYFHLHNHGQNTWTVGAIEVEVSG